MELTIVDEQTKEFVDTHHITGSDEGTYLWYKHNVFGIEEAQFISEPLKIFRDAYFGDRRDLTLEI